MITTAAPKFHALTGTQPVGQTQIATMAEYAGTITTVTRKNDDYWVVVTRDARNAFRGPWNASGTNAAIWRDSTTLEFVVDYWAPELGGFVEADRTRTVAAAIGVATTVTAQRWATQRAAQGR
jgi:hypothetical protein